MKSPKSKKPPEQLPALPEKIRPELNIEKWSIWQPANSRTPLKARVFERELSLPDGKTFIAKLTVGFTHEGIITTDEQRVYYALVKLWEEHGRTEGFTPVSLYRLVKILGKPWGGKDRKRLKRALMRLRITPLVWEKSYIDAVKDTRLDLLHPFTIVDDLKIARRKEKGQATSEVGYFRFHEAILKNLLADHTKPVLFDVVLSFRSDIAQIIYTHLDLILSDKASYERRTKELFEDLGLEGKAYKNLSDRRRALERALPELQGKPLTTGTITTAKLEPTKDGDDFKLVVRKGKTAKPIAREPEPPRRAEVLPLPTKDKQDREAEEVVRHFHRVFHGAEEAFPTTKALDQAATLVAQHGLEKARHIVEFAHRSAKTTEHKIATFGGILQYQTPALRDFEEKRKDRERQKAAQVTAEELRRREAEKQAQADAEEAEFKQYWESLSEEQREAFKTEALANAERYNLGFLLGRYRQQPDKTSPSAVTTLRVILFHHFAATRPGETPATANE